MTKSKNILGQFFTTNKTLQDKVFEFILNKPDNILEPCIGRGDLVSSVKNKNSLVSFDMYEIDDTIKTLDNINKKDIIYCDFMKEHVNKTYNTIIGNPPYVRTKKGNLYIDFTEKCYNLLRDDGELIFIIPSDFFKLTSATKLLNTMLDNGSFTHIFHPHDEKMFDNASVDILIYRYCKNKNIEKKVLYNNEELYINNINGLITFSREDSKNSMLFKDCFDVYVGLVSGKEEIYKNEKLGNIKLLNGENKIDNYIYIDKFPCEDENINNYLLSYKQELISRKIKKFNEYNWFQWGAPRNVKTMVEHKGEDCIYIYNLTRKKTVAFIGKVSYFGAGLIMLKPKTNNYNLKNVVRYINNEEFKNNFIFSGRFKIGHRQISNSIFKIL